MQLISFVLLVWIIISGPFAAIGALSDLTHWNGILLAPVTSWSQHLPELAESYPFLARLPRWAVGVLYLLFLVAFGAWYYWTAILVEAKRQFEIAATGSVGPVRAPVEEEETISEGAAGAVGAGILGGGLGAATTVGVVSGPIGWAILGGVAAIAAYLGWTARRKRNRVQDLTHAEAESKRVETRRLALATQSVADFKRKETRKFLFAWSIVSVIVAVNFVLPMLRA